MTHIKRVNEYNSSLHNQASKFEKELMKRCDYNGIAYDKETGMQYPKNMGDLLDEYGYECDWAIRPKSFSADMYSYPNDRLEVVWVTQDSIDDEHTAKCLKDMFTNLLNETDVDLDSLIENGYDIVFKCGVRYNFNINNPQYLWKVVKNNKGEYELVNAR